MFLKVLRLKMELTNYWNLFGLMATVFIYATSGSKYHVFSPSRSADSYIVIINNDTVTYIFCTMRRLNQDGVLGEDLTHSFNVGLKSYKRVDLPPEMDMVGTGVFNNGTFTVESTSEFTIMMYSKNKLAGNLIHLPSEEQYGKIFYVITPMCWHYSVIHVVAIIDSLVEVTFPSKGNGTLFTTYNGTDYYGGDTLRFQMDPRSSALVESEYDLTGTRVISNSPVGVFSGCDCNVDDDGVFEDFRFDRVPRKVDAGQQYIIMAFKENELAFEYIIFTAVHPLTRVLIYGQHVCVESKLTSEGDSDTVLLLSAVTYVFSDKPIVLVHLVKDDNALYNMYYVDPVERFDDSYVIVPVVDMTMNVRVAFYNGSDDTFYLNDNNATLSPLYQNDFSEMDLLFGGLYLTSYNLDYVKHVQTTSPYNFGGYIFSVSTNNTLYITSLGKNMANFIIQACASELEHPLKDSCTDDPEIICNTTQEETTQPSNTKTTPPQPNITTTPPQSNTTTTTSQSNTTTTPSQPNITTTPSQPTTTTTPQPTTTTTTTPRPTTTTTPQPTTTTPHPTTTTTPQPTTTTPRPTTTTTPQPTTATTPQPTTTTTPQPTTTTTPQPTTTTTPQPTTTTTPQPTTTTTPRPTTTTTPQPTKTTTPQPTTTTTPQPTTTTTPQPTTTTTPQPTTTTTSQPQTISTPSQPQTATDVEIAACPSYARICQQDGQPICYWIISEMFSSKALASDACSSFSEAQTAIIPNTEALEVVKTFTSALPNFFYYLDYTIDSEDRLVTSSGDVQSWTNNMTIDNAVNLCVVTDKDGVWRTKACDDHWAVCSKCQNGGKDCYSPCSCPCNEEIIIRPVNMTSELEQELAELKTAIAVDKKALSSQKRKVTCASDERESSTYMGYAGTVILTVVFGGLVLADVPVLILEFKTHILR